MKQDESAAQFECVLNEWTDRSSRAEMQDLTHKESDNDPLFSTLAITLPAIMNTECPLYVLSCKFQSLAKYQISKENASGHIVRFLSRTDRLLWTQRSFTVYGIFFCFCLSLCKVTNIFLPTSSRPWNIYPTIWISMSPQQLPWEQRCSTFSPCSTEPRTFHFFVLDAIKILVISERLGMTEIHACISATFAQTRENKECI